jgi:hypothetical protein
MLPRIWKFAAVKCAPAPVIHQKYAGEDVHFNLRHRGQLLFRHPGQAPGQRDARPSCLPAPLPAHPGGIPDFHRAAGSSMSRSAAPCGSCRLGRLRGTSVAQTRSTGRTRITGLARAVRRRARIASARTEDRPWSRRFSDGLDTRWTGALCRRMTSIMTDSTAGQCGDIRLGRRRAVQTCATGPRCAAWPAWRDVVPLAHAHRLPGFGRRHRQPDEAAKLSSKACTGAWQPKSSVCGPVENSAAQALELALPVDPFTVSSRGPDPRPSPRVRTVCS